jgi:hypothetical protein
MYVCITHPRNKHSYKILIGDKRRNFPASHGQGLDVNIILKQIREKFGSGNMNWIHTASDFWTRSVTLCFPSNIKFLDQPDDSQSLQCGGS